ncbi:MAG: PilZ domain-containing protein [Lachnospiraceae bacterium]|nr:PilZ domain-containing protein [Lachnospiraceae bacterium]MBQ6025689.1 PilZ domain-containing protein [Lachnospiraceae bacterium]MBR3483680.1 PilZ domain-containing protein [Lachnospiraceae bacterium]MBR3581393.1 PilZ domain-containing protein [Lachnospiraceae bacterium]MBR4541753.1 PilZ domain-containing protein [Lachnospiraceae bacterium]
MQEKRRDKRLPVFSMKLEISSLFKQDNEVIKNLDAPIEVQNVSRGGIGFSSKTDIPLGYYFNACIQMGHEDAKLYCVVKIIRREIGMDGTIFYGCEMVGLAPVFVSMFDEYESELNEKDML